MYDSHPGFFPAVIINAIESKIRECGFGCATDMLPNGGASPYSGIFPVSPEALAELAAEPGFNDKPAIDRVFTALIRSAKPGKPPLKQSRMLVISPTDVRVLLVIAFGFTPIVDDLTDLKKSGSWSLSYRQTAAGALPSVGQGEIVRDADALAEMMVELETQLKALQEKHGTTAPPPRQHPFAGMPIGLIQPE
jgi:hypothetical protein